MPDDKRGREKQARDADRRQRARAIAPSELVDAIVGDVQAELNTVFNLDAHLDDMGLEDDADEPVTITVEDASDDDE